jgi:hypothetical protein
VNDTEILSHHGVHEMLSRVRSTAAAEHAFGALHCKRDSARGKRIGARAHRVAHLLEHADDRLKVRYCVTSLRAQTLINNARGVRVSLA